MLYYGVVDVVCDEFAWKGVPDQFLGKLVNTLFGDTRCSSTQNGAICMCFIYCY